MNIPAIGGARGIFEVFVPGVFLLVNLIGLVYMLPFADADTKKAIEAIVSNGVLVIVIAICFGYLIGMLLRLLRADIIDNLSAAWLRRFDRGARYEGGRGQFRPFVIDEFPYISALEETCKKYLSQDVLEFYKTTWADRKRTGQNKQFFNFCKVLIASVDEKAAIEIYVAESQTRYVVGMFYALVFVSVLVLVALILRYFSIGQITLGLLVLLLVYLSAVVVILEQFRLLRIKEVETVFFATFKNKSAFEEAHKPSELEWSD